MAPEVKQRYQQMAEVRRRKYDQEMAAYLKGKSQKMSVEDRKVYDKRMTSYFLGDSATSVQGNNAIGGGIDPATTTARSTSAMSAATATKTEAAGVDFYRVLDPSLSTSGEGIKEER